jgi:hypothetical protein
MSGKVYIVFDGEGNAVKRFARRTVGFQPARRCKQLVATGKLDPNMIIATRGNSGEHPFDQLGRRQRPAAVAGR